MFSARIAGTVNERPKLLVGPIGCVYARCRIREMGEGFLDQRDLKIMAATSRWFLPSMKRAGGSVKSLPSEHPDFKTDLSGRAPGIAAQSRNAAIAPMDINALGG